MYGVYGWVVTRYLDCDEGSMVVAARVWEEGGWESWGTILAGRLANKCGKVQITLKTRKGHFATIFKLF